MAPSRRKGASKAAAAAAARRQWKVGDLVLAKVKGFPAWPATVSEPEKWGYSADWKKVLVFFFGTQQIAFCNPADVEAFTEEKKQSLLTKRQGRGADFVRAVQEIIDSYEKLKKQDQVDSNSGDEVTVANGGNSVDSISHFGLKDRTKASEATLDSQMKPSNSPAGDGLSLPTEDASAGRQLDALPAEEALPEQPSESLVAKATPVLTTYSSRKRSGGSRVQSTQRMAPSTRRSRSLTMVESCRLQNLMMPYNNEGKNAEDISAKVIRDGTLRRNKRTRKSPDASECNDVDSSALMSNGSIEDNSSEIVTVESDAFSLNEGSTVDSGCKVEDSETVVECLDGDVELSKGLDFQIKAIVVKKKRKPNRKRVCNDAADPSARINTTEVDLGTRNTCHSSENTGGNLDDRDFKEDGDEHLPLVKRARVRMGKPSSEELKSSSQTEEKPSKDVAINLLEHIRPSLNNDDESLTNRGASLVKGSTDNVSPSKVCSEISGNRPQLWKGTTNQSFGCSADGEAVLPPSKRLHRALEAMSANAAEEGQASVQVSSSINTSINGCCVDSICKCSHETMDSRGSNGLELQNGRTCDQLTENSNSQKQESYRDDVGSADNVDGQDLAGSPLSVHTIQTAVQTQNPENIFPDPKKRQSSFQPYQNSLDQLSLKDEGSAEDLQLKDTRVENVDKELNTSAHADLGLDPVSGADESVKLSPRNGSNELQFSVQGMICENSESLKSQIDDNCHINAMCEAVEEIKQNEKQKEMSFVSISDDHLGDKGVTSVLFSSSPAEGVDSPARVSPPNTSLCHISTSESANIVQSSSSSPCARSRYKKSLGAPVADEGKVDTAVTQRPKSVGKWSNCSEAHAALSSFEAVLGSLTRTKESIGRATRIAIDCAKFGVSSKVVEIVARHLESESSLHRRVDLFFLVDSIMQCSRGMKGDVSGIFPSAILTVLPRLLSAAAPPGNVAQENRRQCLKVLRLWLERRILPESIIRHHMRELDTFNCSSSAVAYSRRSARTERALDDPVRDMAGMLVDEYGSNSSFQLPGFCMPRMLKDDDDDGSDSDGGSFEAVTPEHNSETPEEHDGNPSMKKHRHILEEVDGELEMEDVAPTCDNVMSSTVLVDIAQTSHDQLLSFVPPLPQDVPPSSPPLPSSPPPVLPPPPTLPHSCAFSEPYSNGASMQNMQNDVQQSVTQQSVAPRINPTVSNNAVHYHAPECRDHQMLMQMPESTSSFGSYPVCPTNNFQQTDGPRFHSKPYPPRPPHAPQSNQFSYVQAGQNAKSRREAPHPSNSHRFHPQPNIDGGNFYNNHDRMKPGPYEQRDSWRFPAPSVSGPRYTDEARECYASGSYGGPLREPPRYSNRGWAYPPRPMNHRHMRPPSGGAVPVGIRGPGIWRPR